MLLTAVVLLGHPAVGIVDIGDEGVAVGVGHGEQPVIGVVGHGRGLAGHVDQGGQLAGDVVGEADAAAQGIGDARDQGGRDRRRIGQGQRRGPPALSQC